MSHPGIWLLTPGFLQYIFLHYVLCPKSQHDAHWNQQTIFTVTIQNKQTNKQTHTHTHTRRSHSVTRRSFRHFILLLTFHLAHKNTSQFINSATLVRLIQFPACCFLSHVFPLTIQQFFTPQLRFCAFLMLSFLASSAITRQLTAAQIYSSVSEHILNQQHVYTIVFGQICHTTLNPFITNWCT